MVDSTQFSLFLEPAHREGGASLRTALTDPGDLLAALPALFGFYPERSVIFSTFIKEDSADSADTMYESGRKSQIPQPLELGASFRLDPKDLELLPHLAEYIGTLCPEAIFAFIIGEFSDQEKDDISRTLHSASDQGILTLDGVWHTPQIDTGSRYERLFGGTPPFLHNSGVIADIAATPVMRAAQEQDGVPAESREALFGTFAPTWDVLDQEESRSLTKRAHQCFSEVMQLSTEELEDVLHSVSDDARLILTQSHSLKRPGSQKATASVEAEDMSTLATYLLRAPLRDVLLPLAVDYPSTVRVVALSVARNSCGDIRTNALCWYAIAATADQLVNRAIPALMIAQEENPEHCLSRLLLTALRLGRSDYLMEAVEHGRTPITGTEQRDCGLQDPGCTPTHPQ